MHGGNILIVSPVASHPPDAGNRRRLLNLATTLQDLGYCPHLLYTDLFPGDRQAMAQWWGERFYFQPYRPGCWTWRFKRLARGLAGRWPGASRWWRALRRGGRPETFRPILGPVDNHYEPALDRQVAELHRKFGFKAVIAEYLLTSRALLQLDGRVRKLVDTHEVFALGEIARTAPPAKLWLKLEPEDEIAVLRRADVCLAIQDHDAVTLREAGLSSVVTFGHPVEIAAETDPAGALASRNLLLVASGHRFDVDGLEWFGREVFPLLAGTIQPDQVLVAGGIREVLTGNLPPFRFLGRVPDLGPVYRQARVVIAPLREGTGLKIKVVEALGQGKALVSTPFGAKGVEDGASTALMLAGTAVEFAEAIRRLMADEVECRHFMLGARKYALAWNRRQAAALAGAIEATPAAWSRT
jgi:glycosyltransferase involved in cell wall biosynthesis